MNRRTQRGGFTLLETMVAMAVLAFSLATLMGTQAVTIQNLEVADQMHVATMLVRTQMLVIEDELRQEGMQDTVQTDCGDFDGDAFEAFEWCVEIEPVEITEDAEDQFVANVHAELFGEGAGGEGSLSGSSAVSRFLPMIIGQVPTFINRVGERTRKVTLTVSWPSRLGEHHLTVSQYFVVDEGTHDSIGLEGNIPDELRALQNSGTLQTGQPAPPVLIPRGREQ